MQRFVALAGPALVALAACAGGNAATQLVQAPVFEPKGQAKCGVARSQDHPLIVEWASPDRLELENKVRRGLVAVRYVGCEMSVLPRCTVPAKYTYQGATRKEDRVEMTDADDLYANLPVGAAKLEGKLQRSGKLTVNMSLVGRYEAERPSIRADELQGECAGATHFVYGATVGAFDFYAGGDASVGGSVTLANAGGRAHSEAQRESLSRDGDSAACAKSTTSDTAPPEGCGALLRLEVVPLTEPRTASAPVVVTVAPEPGAEARPPTAPPVPRSVPTPMAPPAVATVPAPPSSPSSSPIHRSSTASDSGPGQRRLGLVVGGVGAAGLVAGSIVGGLALSAASTAKGECPTYMNCSPQAISDRSTVSTYGTISTVGIIAGGVLLAGGVTLYFTAPKAQTPRLGMQVAPGMLGLTGGF